MPNAPDLRRGLITVLACEEHNNACSKDDELALYWILMSAKPAEWKEYFEKKMTRVLDRQTRLVTLLFGESRQGTVGGVSKDLFRLDLERFERVMTRIARGLAHHATGKPWIGSLRVVTDFLVGPDGSSSNVSELISTLEDGLLVAVRAQGENPDVFFYQFLETDPGQLVRLCFYSSVSVYVFTR